MGRLLDAIERIGLKEETIIVLTADHGEGLGDHDEMEHGFFVYEQTVRIPLVLRYPAGLPRGTIVRDVVSSMDILPTVARLAGIEAPAGLDGVDRTPDFRGAGGGTRHAYSEALRGLTSYGWSPTRSVRTDEWKYVEAPQGELFDMRNDPVEARNLFDDRPDVRTRMQEMMEAHLRDEEAILPLPGVTAVMDEEQRARLEALGYVAGGGAPPDEAAPDLRDPKIEIRAFNDRQNARVLSRKARVLVDEGRHDEARTLLEKAVGLHPTYFPPVSMLAEIYTLEGKREEAERLYRDYMSAGLEDAESYANAGVALANLGRTEDGVDAMREAVRRAPENKQYRRLLAALERALETGEPIEVRVNFR